MLERDPEKRLDLMDLMDMDFYKHEDDTYKEIVEKHKEDWTRQKEEAKNNEDLKPPTIKVSNVPSPKSGNHNARGGMKFGKAKDSIASPGMSPGIRNPPANKNQKKTP